MKKFGKIAALIIFFIVLFFNALSAQNSNQLPDIEKLRVKAKNAFSFCKMRNYDTSFCILIDMSVHSGLNRLVVWDFKRDTALYSCLVSHGSGQKTFGQTDSKTNPRFSNVIGSHCSSLGRYAVTQRGESKYGVKVNYELIGLDKTNSRAQRRFIVLHSYDGIPEQEVYPEGTMESLGCPAVSNSSMIILDDILQKKTKNVLLWIYT